jgi:hypothetical protein
VAAEVATPAKTLRCFAQKVLVLRVLCAISVSSVSLWLMNSEQKLTTETQRTQRLHRELSEQGLFRQSDGDV